MGRAQHRGTMESQVGVRCVRSDVSREPFVRVTRTDLRTDLPTFHRTSIAIQRREGLNTDYAVYSLRTPVYAVAQGQIPRIKLAKWTSPQLAAWQEICIFVPHMIPEELVCRQLSLSDFGELARYHLAYVGYSKLPKVERDQVEL